MRSFIISDCREIWPKKTLDLALRMVAGNWPRKGKVLTKFWKDLYTFLKLGVIHSGSGSMDALVLHATKDCGPPVFGWPLWEFWRLVPKFPLGGIKLYGGRFFPIKNRAFRAGRVRPQTRRGRDQTGPPRASRPGPAQTETDDEPQTARIDRTRQSARRRASTQAKR